MALVGTHLQQPEADERHSPQFFTEYGEANRYSIKEVIGKGSYGVVCSAVDNKSGEKVAIKKINNVFDHVSDATRILREIKLLRLLRHPGAPSHCWEPLRLLLLVALLAEAIICIAARTTRAPSWRRSVGRRSKP